MEYRILIVEDNLVNQKVVILQLKKFGFIVDVTGNGREALTALEKRDYSIILMDCQMPVMDGYAATHEIRRREKLGARRTPIIALTAHAVKGDREKCLAAGMDDYISKPATQAELATVIERWLKKREPLAVENDDKIFPSGATAKRERQAGDISNRLKLLRDDCGTELVVELVDLFLQDSDIRIERLKKAVNRKEPLAVEREAHGLKGSAANIGATEIAELCSRLEIDAENANLQNAETTLAAICDEFETVKPYLKRTISELVKDK